MQVPSSEPSQNPDSGRSVFVRASELVTPGNHKESSTVSNHLRSFAFVPASKLLNSDSRNIGAGSSKNSSIFVPASKLLSSDSTVSRNIGAGSSKNTSFFVPASKLLVRDDTLCSAVVNDKHFGIEKRAKVTMETTLSSRVFHCSEQKDGFHKPELEKGPSGHSCSPGCPGASRLPPQDAESVIDGHKLLCSEPVVSLSEPRKPQEDRVCVSVPPGRDVRSSRGPQNRKKKEFAKPAARITNFFEK